jgi:hypothetical protein
MCARLGILATSMPTCSPRMWQWVLVKEQRSNLSLIKEPSLGSRDLATLLTRQGKARQLKLQLRRQLHWTGMRSCALRQSGQEGQAKDQTRVHPLQLITLLQPQRPRGSPRLPQQQTQAQVPGRSHHPRLVQGVSKQAQRRVLSPLVRRQSLLQHASAGMMRTQSCQLGNAIWPARGRGGSTDCWHCGCINACSQACSWGVFDS